MINQIPPNGDRWLCHMMSTKYSRTRNKSFLLLLVLVMLTPAYCDDLFMDMFGEASHSDGKSLKDDRFKRTGIQHNGAARRNGMQRSDRKLEKDDYFENSTGRATTKFNSKDIEYIQMSPQSNINDTLKFVPGIRGGNF